MVDSQSATNPRTPYRVDTATKRYRYLTLGSQIARCTGKRPHAGTRRNPSTHHIDNSSQGLPSGQSAASRRCLGSLDSRDGLSIYSERKLTPPSPKRPIVMAQLLVVVVGNRTPSCGYALKCRHIGPTGTKKRACRSLVIEYEVMWIRLWQGKALTILLYSVAV